MDLLYVGFDKGGHPAPRGAKHVYLIRHGESTANAATRIDDWQNEPPGFRDARLSEKGLGQAAALQSKVEGLDLELVVVSPMTRAIQTACLAFEHTAVPLVLWPSVTEFFAETPSCQGRNVPELNACEALNALAKFKEIDTSVLSDNWWSVSTNESRLSEFRRWLSRCPEHRIGTSASLQPLQSDTIAAVVCHWGFIRYLLNSVKMHEELEVRQFLSSVSILWGYLLNRAHFDRSTTAV
jgi:broad specificity phosphatase PhoE